MERQKSFDAVRCMREIRDALSREFRDMSFEEQQSYIRRRVQTHLTEDSSSEYAAHQTDAGDEGPDRLP